MDTILRRLSLSQGALNRRCSIKIQDSRGRAIRVIASGGLDFRDEFLRGKNGVNDRCSVICV